MTIQHQIDSQFGYHKETVPATSTSAAVKIAAGAKRVSVGVTPAGTARVEFTLSTYAEIDGATARWFSWVDGDVTVATADTLDGPVTAVRCVTTVAGTCVFEILQAAEG